MSAIPYLDAHALNSALPWAALIEALDEIFTRDVVEPVRHHHNLGVPGEPDATLLLMPAWLEGEYLGVKQVAVFPGNNARGEPGLNGIYLLSSARSGRPLLQLDANTLTSRRTAAASALASRYLSRSDARVLLMMGAGRMARSLSAAHRAVRPIERVYVWNRNPASARRLASHFEDKDLDIRVCSNRALPEVVAQADIISCATMATEPILKGEWVQPGAHIDLVGAFRPDMRESDDAVIRQSAVFVDTRAGALVEAGDLTQAIDSGAFDPSRVQAEFCELCSRQHRGRDQLDDAHRQLTLFKSVGAAREDLAAAILAHRNTRHG